MIVRRDVFVHAEFDALDDPVTNATVPSVTALGEAERPQLDVEESGDFVDEFEVRCLRHRSVIGGQHPWLEMTRSLMTLAHGWVTLGSRLSRADARICGDVRLGDPGLMVGARRRWRTLGADPLHRSEIRRSQELERHDPAR